MGESAGSLLLRAGLITPDQLVAAHAARQQRGGTLGFHLVRMGIVEEERLAEFYRHRLMVPRVGRERLERVSVAVVERLPRDMAAEFRIVPVQVDGEGNLTLAMSDPADTHAVDEVSFFTGHYVMRAVAIESDIEWALARYYGILRPRDAGPAVAPIGWTEPTQPYRPPDPPPEDTPLLLTKVKPQRGEDVFVLDQPKGKARRGRAPEAASAPSAATAAVANPPAAAVPPSLPVVAPPRSPTKPGIGPGSPPSPSPPAPAAKPAPAPAPPAAPPPPAPPQVEKPSSPAPAAVPATPEKPGAAAPRLPTAVTAALQRLRAAPDRDRVGTLLLDAIAPFYERSALLIVRRGALTGWDSRGSLKPEPIRALAIPVEAPSLLRDVVSSGAPYRGPLPAGPLNNLFGAALGGVPGEIVLEPVRIGERTIGLLYCDTPRVPEPGPLLERLALEAGAAYARIVRAGKVS